MFEATKHTPGEGEPCFGCQRPDEPGHIILVSTSNGPCCLFCLKEMLALPLTKWTCTCGGRGKCAQCTQGGASR